MRKWRLRLYTAQSTRLVHCCSGASAGVLRSISALPCEQLIMVIAKCFLQDMSLSELCAVRLALHQTHQVTTLGAFALALHINILKAAGGSSVILEVKMLTLSDASTAARNAPTWRLHAKAAPGRRSVTWRENLASVLESSSVNQAGWTSMPHRSLWAVTHVCKPRAALQRQRLWSMTRVTLEYIRCDEQHKCSPCALSVVNQ